MRLFSKDEFTLGELVASPIDKVPFLWERFIPQYGITFITGPSNCNKSTLLRQLAIEVASGNTEFLNQGLNTHHSKVILVSTEDMSINIVPLVKKQIEDKDMQKIGKNIDFIFTAKNVINRIRGKLDKRRADLVIFDAWTDLYHGNLNQSNEVRNSLEGLNDLVRDYGCAIVALHHERKGSEDKALSVDNMLGSTGIQAKSRSVFQMSRTSDSGRRLTPLKANYNGPSKSNEKPCILLELDSESMNLRYAGEVGLSNNKPEKGYPKEVRNKLLLRILELNAAGDGNTKIANKLKGEFPGEETPSKNTIKSWIDEYGQSDKPIEELTD